MAAKRVRHVADGSWGNGSIRARGGKWQVRWRESGEHQSHSGFLTRFEAEEKLREIQAKLALGKPGVEPDPAPAPKPRGRAIPALVEEWHQYRERMGKRTAAEERSRWDLHLAPALEAHTLDTVTTRWVRDLATELVKPTTGSKGPNGKKKRPISGPTAHRVLTLLSSFYTWAIDEELATANPAAQALRHKDVKRLLKSKHDGKAAPYLKSWIEVMRLHAAIKHVDPVVARAYLISARAGLRPGEVVALQWDDIDLEAGRIRVERQVRHGKLGPTKSGKARTVPIAGELLEALRADVKLKGLVCPPPHRVKKNGTEGKAWGQYLGPKSIGPALEAAFKATGNRPATLYAYGRHTAASLMALGGMPAFRLQEILGHADIKTTLRYVSLRDQALTPAELAAMGA
jgi:integrase